MPISKLPELIKKTKDDLRSHNLISTIVGHVGDGNFHCIILFKDDAELATTQKCVERMVLLAQDLDGTCTGEHGTYFLLLLSGPSHDGSDHINQMVYISLQVLGKTKSMS